MGLTAHARRGADDDPRSIKDCGMLRLEVSPIMRQEQKLSPRMYQSMEILQLPIMDLHERIEQELLENPVIEEVQEKTQEEREDFEEDPVAPEEPASDPRGDELVIEDEGDNELDFDRLDALSKDCEDVFSEEHRSSRNSLDEEIDKKHDAMQNMASRPQSLQDYLNDQLSYFELPEEQARLCSYLI